jgi:hypothetical protein
MSPAVRGSRLASGNAPNLPPGHAGDLATVDDPAADLKLEPETVLSPKAFRLLASKDLPKAIVVLARVIASARSDAAIQESVSVVAEAGLDPMIVAAVGTPETAKRLGVDQEIAKRFQVAEATVGEDGLLSTNKELFLNSLPPDTVIPWLRATKAGLRVDSTLRLSLPNLAETDGQFMLMNSVGLSLPSLKIAKGSFVANGASELYAPVLATVVGPMMLKSTGGVTFPALEAARSAIDATGSGGLSLPKLKSTGGYFYAKLCHGLSCPGLTRVDGVVDLEEAAGLTLPKLQWCQGLKVNKGKAVSLPKLRIVRGDVHAVLTSGLSCAALKSVFGDLLARSSECMNLPVLNTITGLFDLKRSKALHAPSLAKVAGSILAEDATLGPETEAVVTALIANKGKPNRKP